MAPRTTVAQALSPWITRAILAQRGGTAIPLLQTQFEPGSGFDANVVKVLSTVSDVIAKVVPYGSTVKEVSQIAAPAIQGKSGAEVQAAAEQTLLKEALGSVVPLAQGATMGLIDDFTTALGDPFSGGSNDGGFLSSGGTDEAGFLAPLAPFFGGLLKDVAGGAVGALAGGAVQDGFHSVFGGSSSAAPTPGQSASRSFGGGQSSGAGATGGVNMEPTLSEVAGGQNALALANQFGGAVTLHRKAIWPRIGAYYLKPTAKNPQPHLVKVRRMNPLNVHALRRGLTRAHAFERLARRVCKITPHFRRSRKSGRRGTYRRK